MKNTFSLQQIYKTGNLDPNLISRQYKLNLMAKFMLINFENPKLKESEIADHLGYSGSTLKRHRNDINMLSPYRIQPNNTNKQTKMVSNTNFNNNQRLKHDLKRPQMTSNDLAKPELNTTSTKRNKNILKTGSVEEN